MKNQYYYINDILSALSLSSKQFYRIKESTSAKLKFKTEGRHKLYHLSDVLKMIAKHYNNNSNGSYTWTYIRDTKINFREIPEKWLYLPEDLTETFFVNSPNSQEPTTIESREKVINPTTTSESTSNTSSIISENKTSTANEKQPSSNSEENSSAWATTNHSNAETLTDEQEKEWLHKYIDELKWQIADYKNTNSELKEAVDILRENKDMEIKHINEELKNSYNNQQLLQYLAITYNEAIGNQNEILFKISQICKRLDVWERVDLDEAITELSRGFVDLTKIWKNIPELNNSETKNYALESRELLSSIQWENKISLDSSHITRRYKKFLFSICWLVLILIVVYIINR